MESLKQVPNNPHQVQYAVQLKCTGRTSVPTNWSVENQNPSTAAACTQPANFISPVCTVSMHARQPHTATMQPQKARGQASAPPKAWQTSAELKHRAALAIRLCTVAYTLQHHTNHSTAVLHRMPQWNTSTHTMSPLSTAQHHVGRSSQARANQCLGC